MVHAPDSREREFDLAVCVFGIAAIWRPGARLESAKDGPMGGTRVNRGSSVQAARRS
jgi:hypothetical protein